MSKFHKSIAILTLLLYFISSFYLYKESYFVFIQISTLLILSIFAIYDIKTCLKKKDDKLVLKAILYSFVILFLIFSIFSIYF